MPRVPRPVIAGQPLHIVQRGNNRTTTFVAVEDFLYYKGVLREASERVGCAIHAYVLMTNHVHLLVTPACERGAARLMQTVGRRYVRHFNDRYTHTGTLWEGRYRSTLVASQRYFLACSRYVELNPARAGMVAQPEHYRWSSFRCNAHGHLDALITPHAVYRSLGAAWGDRQVAYRSMFAPQRDAEIADVIRGATAAGTVLGTTADCEALEAACRRPLTRLARGGDRRSVSFARRRHQNSTTLTP